MGESVDANGTELWVERRGQGPDVLLIAGLGDPAEAWQAQLDGLADRYRLSAFDNRGAGRTPLPEEPISVTTMADDAAALLRALRIPSAHVAGFSMGSAIAQELALRHPQLVRSLMLVGTYARNDALSRSLFNFWRWLPEVAPNERAFYEAFFTWVYTPRAHADGSVDQIVEEALAFPHEQSVEAFQAQVDMIFPARFGRFVAAEIANARFAIMPGEAHQPFQEVPDVFNARADAFWREVEASG
jgi:pimeloyl-ACP methyl ester carboxylesterase